VARAGVAGAAVDSVGFRAAQPLACLLAHLKLISFFFFFFFFICFPSLFNMPFDNRICAFPRLKYELLQFCSQIPSICSVILDEPHSDSISRSFLGSKSFPPPQKKEKKKKKELMQFWKILQICTVKTQY
jgi:hypothetical protein